MSDSTTTRRNLLRTTAGATIGLLAGAASVGAATDRSTASDVPTEEDSGATARDPECDAEPPVPVHEITPADTFDDGYVVRAGQPVTLDATDAFDPDGDIVEYEWSLTYGRKYGERVEHGWRAPGGKDVTLTVTDDDGATASADVYVYVRGRR